jgi:3-deoxy-D-manno-octulosonic-acid transferase
MLLGEWAQMAEPRPLLLIVPRHPQRFDDVANLVHSAGFKLARRSSWRDAPTSEALSADVWIGDSMREMALYYAAAHVGLLGGSFERLGGHNLIEAAACGCPLIMGPHTFNFDEAARLSIAAGAAVQVQDMSTALKQAMAMLRPDVQQQFSSRAVHFAAQHRGAARYMAERIVALLRA